VLASDFPRDHLEKPGDPRPHGSKAAKKPGTRKDPKAEIVVKRSLVRRKPQSVIAEEVVPVEDHYVACGEGLPEIFSTPVTEQV
jgi:hypothetical protein